MATKKPLEMSNEELLKNEKNMKLALILSGIAALLMLLSGIWLTFVKGKFNAMVAVAISMSVIAIANSASLKAVQQEKKSRGL